MTQPKMIRCEGSGHEVEGPDEPDGRVQCRYPKCGRSDLIVRRAVSEGEERCFVPEHKRRANPPRRKGAKGAPSARRPPSRNPGRR